MLIQAQSASENDEWYTDATLPLGSVVRQFFSTYTAAYLRREFYPAPNLWSEVQKIVARSKENNRGKWDGAPKEMETHWILSDDVEWWWAVECGVEFPQTWLNPEHMEAFMKWAQYKLEVGSSMYSLTGGGNGLYVNGVSFGSRGASVRFS